MTSTLQLLMVHIIMSNLIHITLSNSRLHYQMRWCTSAGSKKEAKKRPSKAMVNSVLGFLNEHVKINRFLYDNQHAQRKF